MSTFDNYLIAIIKELIGYGRANDKITIIRKLIAILILSISLSLGFTVILPFTIFSDRTWVIKCAKLIYTHARLVGATLVGIPFVFINHKDVVISIVTLLADVIELVTDHPVSFGPYDDRVRCLKTVLDTEPGRDVIFEKPDPKLDHTEIQLESLKTEMANNTIFRKRFECQTMLYDYYWPVYANKMKNLETLLKTDPNEFNNMINIKADMVIEFNNLSCEINNLNTDTDFEIMDSKIRNFMNKYKS